MNTEEKKYQLAICSYIYNNGMPDLTKGFGNITCTECDQIYSKQSIFWVAGLVTCYNCLPIVAEREAKEL